MKTVLPNRLVDYFLSISYNDRLVPLDPARARNVINPFRIAFRPLVIDSFPLTQREDFAIPQHLSFFALPEGIVLRDRIELPEYHSFVLTGPDGARAYGSCVIFYERLRQNVYDALKQETEHKRARMLEDQAIRNERHLSDINFEVEGHGSNSVPHKREVMREDSISSSSWFPQSLFAPNVICVISHWPFLETFKSFLVDIYRCSISSIPLPIERYIANFVMEVPIPPPGKVRVQYSVGYTTRFLERPPINQLPLADVDFERLFQSLDSRNVLTLFECVLLEKKILLISNHYSVLVNCAEAILALIFPFKWLHVYIPLLPSILLDFIGAPVPFIMGIHSSCYKEGLCPAEVVKVDLENNEITLDESLPALPERPANKLIRQLGRFIPRFVPQNPQLLLSADSAITVAPPPDAMDELEMHKLNQPQFDKKYVRTAFLRFFVSVLLKYRNALRTGRETNPDPISDEPFDSIVLLSEMPQSSRKFAAEFSGTQLFRQFAEDRIGPNPSPDVTFFDESIQAKRNRSLLTLKKKFTPFLLDKDQSVETTYIALTPNSSNLPPTEDGLYKYDLFPKLKQRNFPSKRESKVFVSDESDAFGYGIATVASWKTVLATLASMTPKKVLYMKGHDEAGTSLLKKWRARLSSVSSSFATSAAAEPGVFSGPAASRASRSSAAPLSEYATGSGIHQAYSQTFKTVHFDLTETCANPSCECDLSDLDIRQGWSPSKNDYRTTCPSCGTRFVPRFRVFGIRSRRGSDDDTNSDPAAVCEYLSPWVAKKEVENLLSKDVLCDEYLFTEHPTIFWNLILHFRDVKIPLTFLLPQVDWNKITDFFNDSEKKQPAKEIVLELPPDNVGNPSSEEKL